MLVLTDGSTEGTLGDPVLDEAAVRHADELMWIERSESREVGDATLFVDVTFPPPRLIVFGAVDFAAALCRLARAAGWRPYVVDPRARFAQPSRFPDAVEVVAAWPEEAFQRIGGIDRATAIAVLTHDPKLDDPALVLALRSDAGYIGAMGSRRAQAKRRDRLVAKGIDEAELDPHLGADRARPRRADRRGDRAVDHGRDRRHAPRPRRRPAGALQRAHPRSRVRVGGLILAAGEGRRFGGAKQLAEVRGRPLLAHAVAAMRGVPRSTRSWSCSARAPTRCAPAWTSRACDVVVPTTGPRARRRRCAAACTRSATSTPRW